MIMDEKHSDIAEWIDSRPLTIFTTNNDCNDKSNDNDKSNENAEINGNCEINGKGESNGNG